MDAGATTLACKKLASSFSIDRNVQSKVSVLAESLIPDPTVGEGGQD